MRILVQLIAICLIANYCIGVESDLIYIHLIPHSHDDYGWIFTIDQYYNNPSPFAGQGSVKNVINSVCYELMKNPERKFVQVEIGFLNMWWESKSEDKREVYRNLVKNGQIEIVNGGWVMHDEATPYFEDIIDQMTVGHLWLKENLGVIPTVGWQLDPFGHQSSNAALYSQMGFNGQWFARIDYQDKEKRKSEKSLEMIWQPQQNSGDLNYIFSAVNYAHYSAPKDFNFEAGGQNAQVNEYNIQDKADQFVQYFKEMRDNYRTNHLLHTMGEDFAYSRADLWYDNIDQLIEYINSKSEEYGMKILYSTPSIYLDQINKLDQQFPVNKYDFLPYADVKYGYWTGYFTSRPAIKGFTKDTGRYLQAIRNIFAVENMQKRSQNFQIKYKAFQKDLEYFEQQMATMMHHDAITGTEKQVVANDYVKRLNDGYERIRSHLHPLLRDYSKDDIREYNIDYVQCNWNATISQCSITYEELSQGKPVLLMIYNPSVERTQLTRIKVPSSIYKIIDKQNKEIQIDIICPNPTDSGDCDLYFIDNFKGYSYQYYKIIPNIGTEPIQFKQLEQDIEDFKLNDQSSLKIDKNNCQFEYQILRQSKSNYLNSLKQEKYSFQIKYNYYTSLETDKEEPDSGAYIFRPNEQQSQEYSNIQEIGQLVTVVVLKGDKTTSQLIIQNQSIQNVFQIETFVHSISVSDNKGKEIVLVINTDIKNNGRFFTDSNGLELQERKVNQRPTWDLEVNQAVSGNYYPIGAMITIQDINSKQRVSVVNDRSQGGTSLKDGQIEIMIHRRLLKDDARGVGESLSEKDELDPNVGLTQKVRHYLIFENEKEQIARLVQNQLDSFNQIFFAKTISSEFKQLDENEENQVSPLLQNKNPYLRVYLRDFSDYYTLRLYNINDNDSAEFSLSQNFKIVEELTLTANQSKEGWEKQRLKWKGEDGKVYQPQQQPDDQLETQEFSAIQTNKKNLRKRSLIGQDYQNSIQPEYEQETVDSSKIKIKPLQLRVFKIVQA